MYSGKDLFMTHEGCFQILSCDFLIDDQFNPWLMKVSSELNLSIDTKAQHSVITNLIKDVKIKDLLFYNFQTLDLILKIHDSGGLYIDQLVKLE